MSALLSIVGLVILGAFILALIASVPIILVSLIFKGTKSNPSKDFDSN